MTDNPILQQSTIIPTLRYNDSLRALQCLQEAFGFEEHLVVPGENNTITHAHTL